VLAGAFTVVFLVWGRPIAACFVKDPAVISLATLLLVVAGIFQLFDGSQVINTAALRGVHDVRVPALITFIAYWVVALPCGYLLGIRHGFGGAGIWGALAAGLALAAIFLGIRFLRMTREPGDPLMRPAPRPARR
jgi:MATE family multidrug resistance protein